jgi:hypothetical protein
MSINKNARSGQSRMGIIGPFLGPRRYVSERFGASGERGLGEVGSGAEPDGSGDRWGIRPVRIDRRPWPVLGAVLRRANRDG